MSLKYGLLGLLNYGPMTGYELDKMFKESLNFFWQAERSQIYRELNIMKKRGWLSSEIVFQTDRPNKKLYTITDEGKSEFLNWLATDCIDEALFTRNQLLLKTFFSGERNTSDNIKMLKDFKERCEEELGDLKIATKSYDLNSEGNHTCNNTEIYWGITANFGKYYYKMCIDWAEDSINKLKEEV